MVEGTTVKSLLGGSRTPDPQIRSLLLYPSELRGETEGVGFEPTVGITLLLFSRQVP